jgi:pantetheine-phosphate adenylyltransferase, bacterial
MPKAICPGSFDPVTHGHVDIITRASGLFDQVIVVVMINPNKKPAFTATERMEMLRKTTQHLPNVTVDYHQGLLADYARKNNVQAIVKGLRAVTDFEYEFQMAMTNKKLIPEADSVFLTTSSDHMYLSSSLVKQVAAFNGDISDFVPAIVLDEIRERLSGKSV